MFDLESLIRPAVKGLTPYSSARDDYAGPEGVASSSRNDGLAWLDANENPFGLLNRYPDPYQRELKQVLSEVKEVPAENIFVGNGSDEVIDLLFRLFCRPAVDRAVTFPPTYGMYKVSAALNEVEVVTVPLNERFDLDPERVEQAVATEGAKLLFLCSPNNPSGNLMDPVMVEEILRTFPGIVIIDEAYADFTKAPSWSLRLDEFPNLLVCQTLSKAWGLAGARIGIALCSPEIVGWLNRIKPPYNVNTTSQQVAIVALRSKAQFEEQISKILSEREWVCSNLLQRTRVKKIYPSAANFLLVEVPDAAALYDYLIQEKIIVRNRHSVVENCLRITVGNAKENSKLMNALTDEKSPVSR